MRGLRDVLLDGFMEVFSVEFCIVRRELGGVWKACVCHFAYIVWVRNASVVCYTVFRFWRALYVGVQFCVLMSCCYLWVGVFIGISSSLVVA